MSSQVPTLQTPELLPTDQSSSPQMSAQKTATITWPGPVLQSRSSLPASPELNPVVSVPGPKTVKKDQRTSEKKSAVLKQEQRLTEEFQLEQR